MVVLECWVENWHLGPSSSSNSLCKVGNSQAKPKTLLLVHWSRVGCLPSSFQAEDGTVRTWPQVGLRDEALGIMGGLQVQLALAQSTVADTVRLL